MIIGCVKEVKTEEYRVGLTPSCVASYRSHGHKVLIEMGAGVGAGFSDAEYHEAGAILCERPENVYNQSGMIVKVKEPQPSEYGLLREGQILFTYLHLAANRELTEALVKSKVNAVAYETIEDKPGHLPCLKPMSEIAGRLSVQEGAKYLEKTFGGRGILLGGVPGVPRGKVVILGAGVVGTNAAQMAMGLGAEVTILDINAERLAYLDQLYHGRISTLYSTEANIAMVLKEADLLIGAVLIPGAKAPKLIRKDQISMMKEGAVVVDVAVDQGGCIETSHPTTHDNPTFTIDGVVHYCVANMPGGVARTSTMALTSVTLPYGLIIADKGLEESAKKNKPIERGINTYRGNLTHPDVAGTFSMQFTNINDLL